MLMEHSMKKKCIFKHFFTNYLILCRFCSILPFMKYNFSVEMTSGERINLDLYSGDPEKSRPCVVIVHGFKGFKDWGFFPVAATFFEQQNYHAITFNFSHNGISPGRDVFDQLEKFAENTFSREKQELNEIITRVISGEFCNFDGELFIIGHSRGGGVALLAAPGIRNLSAIATWSSISNVDRFTDRQKKIMAENGFIELPNSRTGQMMRINRTFTEDIENNSGDALSIEKAIQNIDKPVLVVHGEIDGTVPVEEARFIYERLSGSSSEIFIVPKADHTFKMSHPAGDLSGQFKLVLEKTHNFFRSNKRG